ncbi:MAG: hypothetical protein JNM31_05610 [Flavobacteriales bacterium]|nr:hypothetical protein [Flavobacteriales bacterium]
MDLANQKALVLSAAKARLLVTEAQLRERIADLKAVTIGDDNAESASQTESTRGSDVDLMNSLGEQREHILREIALLDGMDPHQLQEKVAFGSVVHTTTRDFIVVAGIEEFQAGGRSYLGISPMAPLFQAMQGKHKGDSLTFNGVTYTINELF